MLDQFRHLGDSICDALVSGCGGQLSMWGFTRNETRITLLRSHQIYPAVTKQVVIFCDLSWKLWVCGREIASDSPFLAHMDTMIGDLEILIGILVSVDNSQICNGFTDQEAIARIFGDRIVHRHPDTNTPVAFIDTQSIVLKDGSLCSKTARSPNCTYIMTGRGNFCAQCIKTRNTLGKARKRQASAIELATTIPLNDIPNFYDSEQMLPRPSKYHKK